ncbi:hypothetical protein FACS189459_5700 [Bacilli bacterium]|nr:hypothetical protein FACS189459_5700 [Bacilli bacterium]
MPKKISIHPAKPLSEFFLTALTISINDIAIDKAITNPITQEVNTPHPLFWLILKMELFLKKIPIPTTFPTPKTITVIKDNFLLSFLIFASIDMLFILFN